MYSFSPFSVGDQFPATNQRFCELLGILTVLPTLRFPRSRLQRSFGAVITHYLFVNFASQFKIENMQLRLTMRTVHQALSIEGFSIRRCQVNSFLSFRFKKMHERAKNPFYLVLLTQCILDKFVLQYKSVIALSDKA